MNSRTVVTVMVAALLGVNLVPVSLAQDNNRSAPDGIEIITIIGKRPVAASVTLSDMALVSMSFAQRNNRSAPDGIEVITIVGKRAAPAMATACVNVVTAWRGSAGGREFSEEVPEHGQTSISSIRRALNRCNEKAAMPLAENI